MTVIFLNGPGSSGKSSIAKAIQHLSNKPWLTLGIDSFINMMPTKYIGFGAQAVEGFQFTATEEDSKPVIACETGLYGAKIVEAMPKIIRLLADQGMDIIVDEVLFGDDALQQYVKELTTTTVYFIGVRCSLEAMEEREILRGDRSLGLSRDQHVKVHHGMRQYDFEVDTTGNSAFYCARAILKFIADNAQPVGFKRLENSSAGE